MTTTQNATTTTRVTLSKEVPGIYQAMLRLDGAVANTPLERPLKELVRIRASQINGCAYCIDMHTKDARAVGESEQRLYGLSAWRDTPYFSERERAALAFTEAVTLMAGDHVPDAAYEAVAAYYSPDEVAALLALIIMINAWNAVGVATHAWTPGSYER